MAVPTVDPSKLLSRDAAAAAAAWDAADVATLDAEIEAYRTLLCRLRADLALAGVPCSLEDGGDGEAEAIEGVEVRLKRGRGPMRALGGARRAFLTVQAPFFWRAVGVANYVLVCRRRPASCEPCLADGGRTPDRKKLKHDSHAHRFPTSSPTLTPFFLSRASKASTTTSAPWTTWTRPSGACRRTASRSMPTSRPTTGAASPPPCPAASTPS